MISEIQEAPILAEFFDAQGHRVTAEETRSGLLVIRAWTLDGKLNGFPALNLKNVETLRDALSGLLDREPS